MFIVQNGGRIVPIYGWCKLLVGINYVDTYCINDPIIK